LSDSPTLVVYGDALVDISAQVAKLPESGGDAIVGDFAVLPGGSATNCAAVAGRLGTRVKFIGLTGRDTFGEMLHRDLEAHGVNVRDLRGVDAATGATITLVDQSGQPTYLSFRGAAATVPYGPLPADLLRSGDHLHVSGYSFQTKHSRETARSLMAAAREVGANVSLDPSYNFAREVVESYSDALGGLRFLFPNETEARLMAGTKDPAAAAQRLREMGVDTVLLKMGAEGCLIAGAAGVIRVPAYTPARVVDAAGAGDAFAGGFLAAVLKGAPVEDAARVGNAAAALVIGEVGGHTAAPTVAELRAFAEAHADVRLLTQL
jgi:sugar/nucleoside kinase (ribokinase family)